MRDKKLTQQVILYLIDRLGDEIEGKKKLMKLMFLIEHYNLHEKKLVKEGMLGNTFSIYYYGVFSRDVKDCVNELLEKKIIDDGYPLRSKKKIDLEGEVKGRIEKIIEKFGGESGYQLEVKTLQMMNIEPAEKKQYFGKPVKELIKA